MVAREASVRRIEQLMAELEPLVAKMNDAVGFLGGVKEALKNLQDRVREMNERLEEGKFSERIAVVEDQAKTNKDDLKSLQSRIGAALLMAIFALIGMVGNIVLARIGK